MAKFTIQDLFSIALKYNYINDSYNRNIATFHHAKNQKIMTVEQMIMGIHITIIEKKTGDIIRAEHAHSAVNAILIMEA
jgi:hypothetical protein